MWGRTGRQRLESRLQERPSLQQSRKSSASAQTLPSPADSQKTRAPPPSHTDPHQSVRPPRLSDRVSKQRSPRASRMSAVTKPTAVTKAHPGSSGSRISPTTTATTDASAAERQYTQDLMGLGDRLVEKEPHVQFRRNKASAGSSLNFLAEGATESPFCTLTKPMTDEIDAFLDVRCTQHTTQVCAHLRPNSELTRPKARARMATPAGPSTSATNMASTASAGWTDPQASTTSSVTCAQLVSADNTR